MNFDLILTGPYSNLQSGLILKMSKIGFLVHFVVLPHLRDFILVVTPIL